MSNEILMHATIMKNIMMHEMREEGDTMMWYTEDCWNENLFYCHLSTISYYNICLFMIFTLFLLT